MAVFYNKFLEYMAPGDDATEVTPSDATDLDTTANALYIGSTGSVRVNTANGSDVTFVGVPTGSVIPIRVTRVYSTGTTASSIVAIHP